MNTPPLIGITASEMRHPEPPHSKVYTLSRRYVDAVQQCGGAPLILPPTLEGEALRRVFDRLDGVLLSGGGDLDPALYGEPPHPVLFGLNPARDGMELDLARWAVQERKPILSICRGIQVLNVALGGSLIQDIPSQAPGALQHSFDDKVIPHDYIAHSVRIKPRSRLAGVMGMEEAQTNSWHHQSIKRAADGLDIVAHSPDGIVEAVEVPGHRFAIGVQWHPEFLYEKQPEMRRLFAALVEAARAEVGV